jgi:hypothetical protein
MAAASIEVRFVGAIYDKMVVQALRLHSVGYVYGHQVTLGIQWPDMGCEPKLSGKDAAGASFAAAMALESLSIA